MNQAMQVDMAIVGAGPAGLCLARSLSGQGLKIALLEQQPLDALRDPAFDGREIALTHASRRCMEALGLWARIDAEAISPLRDAKVLNGPSLFSLDITARDGRTDALGWLVPNHMIRRAAFEAVRDREDVQLLAGIRIQAMTRGPAAVEVALEDGRRLEARLLVAADSRFSGTRRAFGIGAQMRDFGRAMMVCRVAHAVPHEHVAWEWFDYGQTLALLPLNGGHASVVLTLPHDEMARMQALDDAALAREFERRFDSRLGAMDVIGSRHVYPLVGVWSDRFVAPRLALVGDAAVGMHPVTAHGFNFGLLGQERLARAVLQAARAGGDIGSQAVLLPYERAHRAATRPLYLATQAIASLYTDDRWPARLVRQAALRGAQAAAPFRRIVASRLARG